MTTTATSRVALVDTMRGLVIVLMALDHVRDYLHAGGLTINPLDPAQTTPLLYATRWVTHLCAPTFVFLAGVSAFLQASRGKTGMALSGFLFTRGLWLIFIELTVLSFGWSFGFPYPFFLQVIWAIGWSMIALAGLVLLPRAAVLAVGLVIIFGHNLLSPLTPQDFGGAALLWTLLHEGGPVFMGETPVGIAAYPVLPWIGIMAAGYGLGPIFLRDDKARDRTLLALGAGMLGLFVVLRFFELYGNGGAGGSGPFLGGASWRAQPTAGAQAMVFLDVQKYPPSLMFTLATLGMMFVLAPLLARLRGAAAHVLLVFGAVPFFFYVLHVYLVHGLAIVANTAAGKPVAGQFGYMLNVFTAPQKFAGSGFSLPWVYVAWIAVVAILYPACAWWAALKRRRKDWWLSYL